jgi:hypothetical protein
MALSKGSCQHVPTRVPEPMMMGRPTFFDFFFGIAN